MIKRRIVVAAFVCSSICCVKKSYASDSLSRFNLHFQLTTIDQWHGSFTSPYQGLHSLSPNEEQDMSLTSTLFLGARLWKYGEVYLNPEVAGGRGFSGATGIAGFTNGEIYRVGDPTPVAYIGRVYWVQYIPLKGSKNNLTDDSPNQLRDSVPDKCFRLIIGKYCLADFFDNNAFSHDPRTQFINWAAMSNGAWDYAANTRGYTSAITAGYFNKNFSLQVCAALEPEEANGPKLDWNVDRTIGLTAEVSYSFLGILETSSHSPNGDTAGTKDAHGFYPNICGTVTATYGTCNIRLLAYNNITRGGNYEQTITNYKAGITDTLNVNSPSAYNGNMKYGFGLSFDMALSQHTGLFARVGWNNGQNATWAYTEIDETALLGVSYAHSFLKKLSNQAGVCVIINGISQQHRDFLNAGGYGFIIGDGKLPDYGPEIIGEAYYNLNLTRNVALGIDYQYVQNPGYNRDRGPVAAVVSGRVHITF